MPWLRKLMALLRRRSLETELDDEFAFHLEMRERRFVEEGMPPAEARRAARRHFGNRALAKEDSREFWGFGWLDRLGRDVRYGLRTLASSPGFTAVAVLSLALGIGANTAIFSIVNAILLRPLPYGDPERLVDVLALLGPQKDVIGNHRYADYLAWKDDNDVFEDMTASYWGHFVLRTGDHVERLTGHQILSNYFPLLGVEPILGRNFTSEEEKKGAPPVVILSHSLWRRLFGADSNIVGKVIRLDREMATVIGVMPPLRWPTIYGGYPLLWVPYRTSPADYSRKPCVVTARLKPGVPLQRAQTEMDAIEARRALADPERLKGPGIRVERKLEALVGEYRPALVTLLGGGGLLLLIACANVGGLLLARMTSRGREIATRLAMGASRLRLVRQLLTESALLASAGAVLGVLAAYLGVRLILLLNPDDSGAGPFLLYPRLDEAGIDIHVLGYTLLISFITVLLFGAAPAWMATRPQLNEALKDGARSSAGSGAQRWRSALVIAQVSLAFVLLIATGLMLKNFIRLRAVDPGFDSGNLLTFQLQLDSDLIFQDVENASAANMRKARLNPAADAFFEDVLERIRRLPGVESAAAIGRAPLSGWMAQYDLIVDGSPPPAEYEGRRRTGLHPVTVGFFETMRIPLLKGRVFGARDSADARQVVLINQTVAHRYWRDGDPIGKSLIVKWGGDKRPREVIGVVADVRHRRPGDEASNDVYVPHAQMPLKVNRGIRGWRVHREYVVRSLVEPASLAPAIRKVVAAADPELPISRVVTMKQLIETWTNPVRFDVAVPGAFAAMGLLLAAVGVYGVMAYSVSRRTHEIGIRMALGARQSDAAKLVIRRGLFLASAGIALGTGTAIGLTRLAQAFDLPTLLTHSQLGNRFLDGITAADPATFAAVSLLLAGAALLACYFPARRATKVNPAVALRYE